MRKSASKMPLGAHITKHGVSFRVWAPFADSVAVTGSCNDWGRTPLNSDGDGCWSGLISNAEAGQEYKYAIKNGDKELVRNDPRSLRLTTTSGGTSVIVDEYFDWEDDNFTSPPHNKQVIYELHVGTFHRSDPASTGTFEETIKKLDHLADLGINMIEFMPISSMSSDRGWGYATDYMYAVESLYGGRQGLLEFVKAAHKRGIGVILDVVYNHFGPDPGNLDLWQFDGWHQNNKGGIYFYNDSRAETPWGDTRPDYGRTEVQDYILDSVVLWLADCHIDGLRADSTIYLRNIKGFNNDPDNDIPEGWLLMQRLTTLARKINPNVLLIAEDVGANEYITSSESAGGAGFSSQWDTGFPNLLRAALRVANDKERNLDGIAQSITKSFNNDAFRRVIYSDSHDTAANGGARLTEEISPGNPASLYARKRSLLASALVMTAPGIPMIFQGQEFNEGGSFNDWQVLDWSKAEQFKGIVLAHKHLISLRKNEHSNTAGLAGQHASILHTDTDNNVIAFHRWEYGGPKDDTVVIMNFNNQTQSDYRINFPQVGTWRVRFNSSWSGYSPDFKDVPLDEVVMSNDGATVKLAPYSVLILSQD